MSGTAATSLPNLLVQAYELRGAGAVLHGHSMNAFLATLLDPEASELRLTHIEMIKGIAGQARGSSAASKCLENSSRTARAAAESQV